MSNGEMILQPLDVIFYKGHKPVSLGVRLLTSIRYGIPFKDCLSHVDIRYNDSLNISAEPSGTKLVEFEKSLKHNDITVYRFRQLPSLDDFYAIVDKLLNDPYSYARYIVDFSRTASFTGAIMGFFFRLFSKLIFTVAMAWSLFLQLLVILFRKADLKAYDCSEVVAKILVELNLMASLPDFRNEFPNSIKSKLQTMCLHGLAGKVGTWDHKTKKWVEY